MQTFDNTKFTKAYLKTLNKKQLQFIILHELAYAVAIAQDTHMDLNRGPWVSTPATPKGTTQ